MKIDYTKPLTPEQITMVEQHHNLIYGFLRAHNLPIDDYYDIAAEGLIRGVQAYYAQDPRLQEYNLSTIVQWKIRSMLWALYRRKRRAPDMMSLDYMVGETGNSTIGNIVASPKASAAYKQILDRIEIDNIFSYLTPEQQYLFTELADGAYQEAIGRVIGISQVSVSRRVKKARSVVMDLYREEACNV